MLAFLKEHKKQLLYINAAIIGLGMLLIYGMLNPADYTYFPKCPFYSITGYQCPGCGSQRAIHHILNGELVSAFRQQPLIFIFTPYIILYYYFELSNNWAPKRLKYRKRLFGQKAILSILVFILMFWAYRIIMG